MICDRLFLFASATRALAYRTNGSKRWMSARPESKEAQVRKKVTIQKLNTLKQNGTPITMLTAHDYPTGIRCELADIDITLVGDSLAQVALGYDSTTRLTMDEMLHHIRAVGRGSHAPLLVADLPFGTYYASTEDAVRSAVRMIREGGVEAVKIEGGRELVPTVKALTSVGIAVMAHIGLLPQRHTALSGYRVQGRDAASAIELAHAAEELQNAGAFSIVLEAIPHLLAAHITKKLHIPTIGIGAGPRCDGQVLVQDDALGIWSGHKAKFVRRFADIGVAAAAGVDAYAKAVKDGTFPAVETESYGIDQGEWEKFVEHERVWTTKE
ncbi:3-methyl-2-oxobutanoatehydroxymethyltransferase [Ceratobasidium theobromae]|uniref:3-methyl-2-oxobutanoate hydroxymethyltransferase n=1 Tax=Ceratobasidium theobromae TaxID=1582974 RepID=A0A5N5QQ76_9AGAM|nr:3-methyl-2-oxobutanoatehydroxymethyltransferase [Ceratobasidium theobromae]